MSRNINKTQFEKYLIEHIIGNICCDESSANNNEQDTSKNFGGDCSDECLKPEVNFVNKDLSDGYKHKLSVAYRILIEKLQLSEWSENLSNNNYKKPLQTQKELLKHQKLDDLSNCEISLKIIDKSNEFYKQKSQIRQDDILLKEIQNFNKLWEEIGHNWDFVNNEDTEKTNTKSIQENFINNKDRFKEPEIQKNFELVESVLKIEKENKELEKNMNELIKEFGFGSWEDFPLDEVEAEDMVLKLENSEKIRFGNPRVRKNIVIE